MNRLTTAIAICAATIWLSGCILEDDADVASRNLSRAADNFEVMRRVVFMNGITDEYMLEIIGLCSLQQHTAPARIQVTCQTDSGYIRHQMGLSDNVTYFAEQLESVDVSVNHYRVTFRPQAIIPDFDLRGSFSDLVTNHSEINQ